MLIHQPQICVEMCFITPIFEIWIFKIKQQPSFSKERLKPGFCLNPWRVCCTWESGNPLCFMVKYSGCHLVLCKVRVRSFSRHYSCFCHRAAMQNKPAASSETETSAGCWPQTLVLCLSQHLPAHQTWRFPSSQFAKKSVDTVCGVEKKGTREDAGSSCIGMLKHM